MATSQLGINIDLNFAIRESEWYFFVLKTQYFVVKENLTYEKNFFLLY
jgi:hypothetical protein